MDAEDLLILNVQLIVIVTILPTPFVPQTLQNTVGDSAICLMTMVSTVLFK